MIRTNKHAVWLLISISLPLFGWHHYHKMMQLVSASEWSGYSYWLSPLWSVVMYASSMYQWGGVLGVCIGVVTWKNGSRTIREHGIEVKHLLRNAWLATVVGIIVWMSADLAFYRMNHATVDFATVAVRSMLAELAVYQYIVFWALLAYACAELLNGRLVSCAVLIGIQVAELFWVVHNHPSWEVVLPTAISRLSVALAYPVWKEGSWAAEHPTFLGSSPMTLTDEYVPIDLGVPWLVMVEGIYILLSGCAVVWSLLKKQEERTVGIK